MDQVAAGRRVEKTGSPEEESGNGSQKSGRAHVKPLSRSFILMAGALVLLFSIVNGSGFSFPAADLGDAVIEKNPADAPMDARGRTYFISMN